MASVKYSGVLQASYRYNALGEQVRRTAGTDAVFVYDEAGRLLGQYLANGTPIQQYVWMDDQPVGVISGGSVLYVEPDHLGTPRAVIDPVRQKAVWTWDLASEAFGDTAPNADPDADGTAFVFDLRFPGQRYDSITGLHYNYYRDYAAGEGRYVQSDPIGLAGGISTYLYAQARPTYNSDPSGLLDIQARYVCTPTNGCYYTYKFDFTTSTFEAYADRFGRSVAGFAIGRGSSSLGRLSSGMGQAERAISRLDGDPVGSSELPWIAKKGISVCADADDAFEKIYDKTFPGRRGEYLRPQEAKQVIDALQQDIYSKIRNCGYFNTQCQDPYRRIKSFYDFDNILDRANQRLDVISRLKRDRGQ